MPFPSEHTARLKSPGQFDKFRRQNDAGGLGVDFIYGIKDGKTELQAIRFDKDKFSIAQAHKWLKDNKKDPVSFTPASDEKGSEHSGPSAAEITVPTANNKVTVQYNEEGDDDMELKSDDLVNALLQHPDLSLPQLQHGMNHELEHTDNREIALKIALDHLLEHPDYYVKLDELFQPKDHASQKEFQEIKMDESLENDDEELDEDDEFALGLHDDGTMCVEAFRAGTHTDSAGNTESWGQKDIEDIANKGNAQITEKPIPVVIGHPDDTAPAYGWVEKFKVVGDKIRAKLTQLNGDFVKALKDGAYKGRSISLYDDNRVRHLGFLGGAQPAIEGLKPFSFEEAKTCRTFDFNEEIKMSEFDERDVNFLYRLLKRFGLEVKKGKEKQMPEVKNHVEDTVKKAEEGAPVKTDLSADDAAAKAKEIKDPGVEAEAKVEIAKAKDEANEESKENEDLKALITALTSRIATLEEALKNSVKNHSELESKNKELEAKVEKAEEQSLADFVESLIANGQLRPAERELTLMGLNAQVELDKAPIFNMSEAKVDGNKKSRLETYKEMLMAKPKIVQFGEFPDLPAQTTGVSFPSPASGADLGSYIEQTVAKKMAEQDKLALTTRKSYWDVLKDTMAECAKENPEAYAEYVRKMMPGIR